MAEPTRESLLPALRQVNFFDGLDERSLELIAAAARLESYPQGHVLFTQGDPGDRFYVILSGSLELTVRAEAGIDSLTLAVLGAGDYLGEMALLDGGARSATASVAEAVKLLSLHRGAFLELIAGHHELTVQMLKCVAKRLRQASQEAAALAHMDVFSRVVRKLADLALRHGRDRAEGREITLELDHQKLANMVGADPDGVKLLLDVLLFDGLILHTGGHFTVPDLGRLMRAAVEPVVTR